MLVPQGEPAVPVEPAHVDVPLVHAHVAPVAPVVPVGPVAPVVPSVPAVVPAVDYHVYDHHHPYSELHNVAKSYAKEAGHASETAIVSGHGHVNGFRLHAPHLADPFSFIEPWRSRLHHHKAAKKVQKTQKTVNKKTH
ncbi:unnamed protein product [Strongylus vulgaris]|uniref:Uncharacterized protein n=1 Tax=Strongylus vulgaris TaxID=40348 RepID=A0A3P7JFZ5_STRVU|nr:unnamed protein product [Strongylus vulgaris]